MPEGVVVVRIDQGDVRNAVNSETAERLFQAFRAFDADDAARVAVLTGDAQAFCAGANLRDLPKLRDSGPLGPTRLQLGKPVIAAINGDALASGYSLVCAADVAVAVDHARIGTFEASVGIWPMIAQVPALLVTLPAIAYIWSSGAYATAPAVTYSVLLLLAGMLDNVLKPLMLGRGVDAPMPVILLGALGGMAASGILGMFLGATLLALGYQIFMGWVAARPDAPPVAVAAHQPREIDS